MAKPTDPKARQPVFKSCWTLGKLLSFSELSLLFICEWDQYCGENLPQLLFGKCWRPVDALFVFVKQILCRPPVPGPQKRPPSCSGGILNSGPRIVLASADQESWKGLSFTH